METFINIFVPIAILALTAVIGYATYIHIKD